MLCVRSVRSRQHQVSRRPIHFLPHLGGNVHAHVHRAIHSDQLHPQPEAARTILYIGQPSHLRFLWHRVLLRFPRPSQDWLSTCSRYPVPLPLVLRNHLVCSWSRWRGDCSREQHENAQILWRVFRRPQHLHGHHRLSVHRHGFLGLLEIYRQIDV